jgi:hydrogenase 3 maturation protease
MPASKKPQIRRKRGRAAAKTWFGWRGAVSRALDSAERLFVLGIGNTERGDDAAGSLFIRLLGEELARRKPRSPASASVPRAAWPALGKSAPREFQTLDGGAAPENVTGLIRKFRPTHVLIIDAAVGSHRPGTIFVMDKNNIREDDISTHRPPLSHLVRYLEEDIGCRVILIGIEPKATGPGKPVSREVKAAAVRLAVWLGEALAAHRS